MLKVTLIFTVYCAVVSFCGCKYRENELSVQQKQQFRDSVSEARIDSAYAFIKNNCDTLMKYQVPKMLDSLLKDSALLQNFFDTNYLYRDADKKVENVIRQLLADCDSSLLKETYRRAQLRQQSKLQQRKK